MLWWVEHLPEDSATVAALRGGSEHPAWTSTAHLLASVVDAVQVNTWTTVAAHAKRRPKPPTPLPRPTSPSRWPARVVTVAAIAAQQANTRG